MLLLATILVLGSPPAQKSEPITSDIEAAGPNGPPKGTFTGQAGAGAPVVLIIPGSGPTDRDGNNPLGVKAAPYKLLAEGLAERGVASVRIDKRGMFASAAAVRDANAVTVDDYARDTIAWIDAIRQRTGSRCVWLLGHSEGGLVALATAAQERDHICGLVLVSTAGRPLSDVLKGQLRANSANAPLLDAADRAIDRLAGGTRVDVATLPPALKPLFYSAVQGFLISSFALDPAKLIQRVRKPVLILQGERDIQVDAADAERLTKADPTATLKLLPDTNHVLKRVTSEDRGANLATYSDPDLPLAPGVIDAVAQFVLTKGL